MKPSVGRIVHWNTDVRGKISVRPALIVECVPKHAVGANEYDFDVTLEVHGVAVEVVKVVDLGVSGTTSPKPHIYIVEHAPYSPALSGHSTAVEHWTWPRES